MSDEPRFPLLSISRHRFASDGEGITTLAAAAGCPLSCAWCLNGAVLKNGVPKPVTPRELYQRVRIDDLYFRATGGGVTFGGGEPLLYAGFIRAFRDVCGGGWRLTAETSLAVPWEQAAAAAEALDDFIIDCKDMDAERYRRYTGGDVSLMRGNLQKLLRSVGPERLHVRVPLIPDHNTADDQAESVRILRKMGIAHIETFTYIRT